MNLNSVTSRVYAETKASGEPDGMPDIPGFVLHEKIGSGGFGDVYRATKVDAPGGVVAIKVARDPALAEVIRREGAVVHGLDHHGIIKTIESHPEHDPPYLVMEFAPGGNLRAVGQVEPIRALGALRGILLALAHAHAHGVVHRDIKPENILIDAMAVTDRALDLHLKIADFGLGKIVDQARNSLMASGTSRSGVVGTPQYMAPEQRIPGETVDGRADIYSAGVVFFELLTGRCPDRAEKPSDYCKVSSGVDDIFAKCCARVEKRYQSADDALAAVRAEINDLEAAASLDPLEALVVAAASCIWWAICLPVRGAFLGARLALRGAFHLASWALGLVYWAIFLATAFVRGVAFPFVAVNRFVAGRLGTTPAFDGEIVRLRDDLADEIEHAKYWEERVIKEARERAEVEEARAKAAAEAAKAPQAVPAIRRHTEKSYYDVETVPGLCPARVRLFSNVANKYESETNLIVPHEVGYRNRFIIKSIQFELTDDEGVALDGTLFEKIASRVACEIKINGKRVWVRPMIDLGRVSSSRVLSAVEGLIVGKGEIFGVDATFEGSRAILKPEGDRDCKMKIRCTLNGTLEEPGQ